MKKHNKSKPKSLIIVLFQNLLDEEPIMQKIRHRHYQEFSRCVNSIQVEVEVLHEMVRPIDYNTDAEFYCSYFMDYLSPHMLLSCVKIQSDGKSYNLAAVNFLQHS